MRYYFLFFIIACSFGDKCYSNEPDYSIFQELPFEIESRECFCYEFGNKTRFYVIATESQTGYDLYVSLNCKQNWHKRHITESSVLEWGFNDFVHELDYVTYEKSNVYSPIFFTLSYINGDKDILVSSNEKTIVKNNEVLSKLADLQSFLMGIWALVFSTQ